MTLRLQDFLVWLAARRGQAHVAEAVRRAIKDLRDETQPDLDREQFLDFHGLRRTLNSAVNFTEGRIADYRKLDQVIRRLKIHKKLFDLGMESRFSPWDTWRAGSRIAVVLGGKTANLASARKAFRRTVVGLRDAEAYARLLTILREQADIDFQDELYLRPSGLAPREAEAFLQGLCRRKNVGAIVVLGSPLVNPLTDPIARLIFESTRPQDLPARFRWSFSLQHQNPFLWEPGLCGPQEEGIRLRRHRKTTFPRVRDETVLQRIQRSRRRIFPDCGVLAISTRHEKILVLCAGHGGCGTMAAVLGLSRLLYIERRLLEVSDPTLPVGRFFEPLWVKRRKHTRDPVDDFYFNDRGYGRDWRFAWDEEDEAPAPGAERPVPAKAAAACG